MVLDDLTHVNDSHVGKRTLSKLDFAREFSQQQSLHISDDMMKCLGRDELIIDQDTISRGDLLLATTIFSTCPTFKKVVIVSTSSPGDLRTASHRVRGRMPAVKMDARAVSNAILRGLSKNCHLQAIEFEGLSDLVAKKLPRTLRHSANTLKSIRIRNMNIKDEGLSKIIQTLMSSEVTEWQFSACSITSESLNSLRSLLQIHCNRRNCKQWQYGLRGDSYNPHEEGIIRLDLSNNVLTDAVVTELAEILQEDKWILALDISHTQITNQSLHALQKMLKTNTCLASLDLEDRDLDDVLLGKIQNSLMENRSKSSLSPSLIDRYAPQSATAKRILASHQIKVQMPNSDKALPGELGTTPFQVDVLLEKVMSDLQEHENARQHADARIQELEDENACLHAELARMKAQAEVPSTKVRKNQRRKRKKNSAKKPQTLNAEDVEQLNQLVGFLDGLFQRLHMYMDELEANASEKPLSQANETQMNALSEEVRKSSNFFGQVASRIQAINSNAVVSKKSKSTAATVAR